MVPSDPVERLIPWYVNGTLAEDDRRRVEDHLPGCDECRSLLEESRRLEGLGGGDADEMLDHVHAQHLESFARDPDSLSPELAGWIRSHLDACGACRGAREILGRLISDPELSPEAGDTPAAAPLERTMMVTRPPWWGFLTRTVLRPAAAVAYLVLLIAAVPLYRGLVHLPDVASRAMETASAGGAIDVTVLSSALRGEDQVATVHLAAGQALAALGAEFELPAGVEGSTQLRFSVRREGRELWSARMEASRAERNLGDGGVVTLLVPTARLESGRHQLLVVSAAGGDAAVLADLSFEVNRPDDSERPQRQSPAPTNAPQ